MIDVEAKKARRLTQGAFTVGSFDWSPDGKEIAFDHTINPDPSSGGTADISVVSVADAKIRPLVTQSRPGQPAASGRRTARRIAFSSAMAEPFNYFTNSHIADDSGGRRRDRRI